MTYQLAFLRILTCGLGIASSQRRGDLARGRVCCNGGSDGGCDRRRTGTTGTPDFRNTANPLTQEVIVSTGRGEDYQTAIFNKDFLSYLANILRHIHFFEVRKLWFVTAKYCE